MQTARFGIGILVVLLVGCGPAPSVPSPSSAAAPAVTADVPAASPAASPSSAARELPAGRDALEPGRYTRVAFRPAVTFELGDGWFVGSLAAGFFDVQQQQGTPDVIAVQFGLVRAVIGADGSVVPATTAEATADAVAANPAVIVLAESASQLGGLTGFNLEIENQGAAHAPIVDVPAGRLGIDPARRLWISLFDTDDGVLAVMVGGSVADWDHALAVAEPVLESIVIGEPEPGAG